MIEDYYKSHGESVMENMRERYGKDRGKSVFYATANKRGLSPDAMNVLQGRSKTGAAKNRRRKKKK